MQYNTPTKFFSAILQDLETDQTIFWILTILGRAGLNCHLHPYVPSKLGNVKDPLMAFLVKAKTKGRSRRQIIFTFSEWPKGHLWNRTIFGPSDPCLLTQDSLRAELDGLCNPVDKQRTGMTCFSESSNVLWKFCLHLNHFFRTYPEHRENINSFIFLYSICSTIKIFVSWFLIILCKTEWLQCEFESSIPRDSQILPRNQLIPESFIQWENTVIKPLQLNGGLFFSAKKWLNNESVIKFVACAKIRCGWVAYSNVVSRDRVSTSRYAWTEQLFSATVEINYQMPSEKLCHHPSAKICAQSSKSLQDQTFK